MPVIVGLIHADWCGHCQRLMPKWNEMKNGINVNHEIMEIEFSDPEKDNKLMDLNRRIQGDKEIYISGYPTVFRIDDKGKLDYFEKEHEVDPLMDFFNNTDAGETPAPMSMIEDKPKKEKKTRKKRKSKGKKKGKTLTKGKSKGKTEKKKGGKSKKTLK